MADNDNNENDGIVVAIVGGLVFAFWALSIIFKAVVIFFSYLSYTIVYLFPVFFIFFYFYISTKKVRLYKAFDLKQEEIEIVKSDYSAMKSSFPKRKKLPAFEEKIKKLKMEKNDLSKKIGQEVYLRQSYLQRKKDKLILNPNNYYVVSKLEHLINSYKEQTDILKINIKSNFSQKNNDFIGNYVYWREYINHLNNNVGNIFDFNNTKIISLISSLLFIFTILTLEKNISLVSGLIYFYQTEQIVFLFHHDEFNERLTIFLLTSMIYLISLFSNIRKKIFLLRFSALVALTFFIITFLNNDYGISLNGFSSPIKYNSSILGENFLLSMFASLSLYLMLVINYPDELTLLKKAYNNTYHREEKEHVTSTDQYLKYYTVLGLTPQATESEIKKAFRLKSRENHPDKVATMDDKFKELAEERMKVINEAYSTLINKRK